MATGKERIIICANCGAMVVTRYSRTTYCKDCAEKRNAIYKARSKEKKRLAMGSDVDDEPMHYCDSPERIQMCLNCERPTCINCFGSYAKDADNGQKTRGAFLREVKDEFIAYVKQGKSNEYIAGAFYVHIETVREWKRKLRKEGLL